MNIKKGDTVFVRTGKDKGKTGKVVRSFPATGKVIIAGISLSKRHSKPRRTGQKGQIVDKPMPIDASNVSLIDPKTGKPARVHVVTDGKKRVRVSALGNRID
jgi:large subunit ribosomal protein L24